jgi:hypothetical protein
LSSEPALCWSVDEQKCRCSSLVDIYLFELSCWWYFASKKNRTLMVIWTMQSWSKFNKSLIFATTFSHWITILWWVGMFCWTKAVQIHWLWQKSNQVLLDSSFLKLHRKIWIDKHIFHRWCCYIRWHNVQACQLSSWWIYSSINYYK